ANNDLESIFTLFDRRLRGAKHGVFNSGASVDNDIPIPQNFVSNTGRCSLSWRTTESLYLP
ncbi:hypothetical protein D041_0721B, partial [Vibrio parahaemolyticus EKP-008]